MAESGAAAVAALLVLTAASGRRARRTSSTAGVTARLRAVSAPAPDVDRRWRGAMAPAWLAGGLAAMAVDVPAASAWRVWPAMAVASAVGGFVLGGVGLAVIGVVSAAVGPVLAWWMLRGRGDARYAAALPGALESVARSLRSGSSLVGALAEASSASPPVLRADLGAVVARTRRGLPLTESLRRWAEARPLNPVRLVVACLSLGVETGGPQARALDGVAATLREHLAVTAEIRALTSQARASAVVISLAPVAFGVVAAAADPRSAAFLLRTPLGLVCLAAGLCLDGLAAVWMARLARSPR